MKLYDMYTFPTMYMYLIVHSSLDLEYGNVYIIGVTVDSVILGLRSYLWGAASLWNKRQTGPKASIGSSPKRANWRKRHLIRMSNLCTQSLWVWDANCPRTAQRRIEHTALSEQPVSPVGLLVCRSQIISTDHCCLAIIELGFLLPLVRWLNGTSTSSGRTYRTLWRFNIQSLLRRPNKM